MKIHIADNDKLLDLYTEYGVKLGAKVHKLIIAILEAHNDKGTEALTIYINPTLLPVSYSTVPAMLARSIAPHVSYLSVQCFLKGEIFEIIAGDAKYPSTFRARAVTALLEKKRFVCKKIRVPKTYRLRPKLLAAALLGQVDGHIATIAKPTKIIWKLTKTKE